MNHYDEAAYLHPRIDRIIELFKDGKWHTIKEICQKSKMYELKIDILTDFLADYSFIELDHKEKKAKSSKAFAEFLKKTATKVLT